jgi:hypothetical protein
MRRLTFSVFPTLTRRLVHSSSSVSPSKTIALKEHSPPVTASIPSAPLPLRPYKRCHRLSHSPPRPKPLQPSPLPATSLLSSRANRRRHHLTIVGLPPAPHRPPSPTVGTPEVSSSFSPTASDIPLTRAAPSPRSGEPFGRRRPWSTVDT